MNVTMINLVGVVVHFFTHS